MPVNVHPAAPPEAPRPWFRRVLVFSYLAAFGVLGVLLVAGWSFYTTRPSERAHHEGYWQWKPGSSIGIAVAV